jgi:hypothetical protein
MSDDRCPEHNCDIAVCFEEHNRKHETECNNWREALGGQEFPTIGGAFDAGWQAAEARLEPVIASLRRDLETPPPDVQEKVIQMLDLVSRDALKKAVEDAVNAALLEALNKAKSSFTVEEAIGKIYGLRGEKRK